MLFSETTLCDALLVDLQPAHDNRGFFARSFNVEEFAPRGLQTDFQQHSVSYTARAGYQPELARGFRYDDPAFAINWPLSVTEISDKDLHWPASPSSVSGTPSRCGFAADPNRPGSRPIP